MYYKQNADGVIQTLVESSYLLYHGFILLYEGYQDCLCPCTILGVVIGSVGGIT